MKLIYTTATTCDPDLLFKKPPGLNVRGTFAGEYKIDHGDDLPAVL